jgi:acyl-CoA reductase-like NAD-dependent aldehyde dehydrogenase
VSELRLDDPESITDRAHVMKAAATELRANAARYAQLVTVEMGKLIGTSEAEVGLSAAILDYYADRAETFLAPKELPESPGAVIETEPIGVILGIEPWNFPYYQLARVAGPQLMAGNVLVTKHAENVPQCALAFARLFETAGAPAGVYTNVFASIDQIGRVIEEKNPASALEFFGPVASFYFVDTEAEAIELANATPFGLGASVFTSDVDRGRQVARHIESGMVYINQPAWTAPEIPFGGIKNSGFGRELSELGFGEFVNRKLVNVAPAGAPPWGPVPL